MLGVKKGNGHWVLGVLKRYRPEVFEEMKMKFREN